MRTVFTDYDKQTADFVAATGLKITKEYTDHRLYFDSDKEQRSVWRITLLRDGRPAYVFMFGQSIQDSYNVQDLRDGRIVSRYLKHWPHDIHNAKGYRECLAAGGGEIQGIYRLVKKQEPPTDYTILAGVEKYTPDTFEDFCSEYGYDTDSRKALDTFLAVQRQAVAIRGLFTEAELKRLAEIQ